MILKFFIISIMYVFLAKAMFGQNTMANQKTNLTPHKFSSSLSKQDTASKGSDTKFCISCHLPGNNKPIITKSSLPGIHESKKTIQTSGDYIFNSCPMCSKVNAPDGISSLCLSCHDGAVAQNRLARQPATILGDGEINLMNSHPISFVYDPSPDNELWPVNHVYNEKNTVKDLLDENNEVQCTSCHTMHGGEFEYYLRMNNEKSALCLVCHKR